MRGVVLSIVVRVQHWADDIMTSFISQFTDLVLHRTMQLPTKNFRIRPKTEWWLVLQRTCLVTSTDIFLYLFSYNEFHDAAKKKQKKYLLQIQKSFTDPFRVPLLQMFMYLERSRYSVQKHSRVRRLCHILPWGNPNFTVRIIYSAAFCLKIHVFCDATEQYGRLVAAFQINLLPAVSIWEATQFEF